MRSTEITLKIGCLFFMRRSNNWHYYSYLFVCLTFFLISVDSAHALSCDGKEIEKTKAGTSCYTLNDMDYDPVSYGILEIGKAFDDLGEGISKGKCGVCRNDESSYFDPKITVTAESYIFQSIKNWSRTKVLRPSQCKWMYAAYRFCARYAKPDPDPQKAYGNETYNSNNPRLMLCGYYDSMDGMDTSAKASPFHFRVPNESAPSPKQAAIIGAASSAVVMTAAMLIVPGVGLLAAAIVVAFSTAIAVLVALITSHYNHFVIGNLGCVDIPLAPGPPTFSDDRWHAKFLTKPDLKIRPESDFFNISIDAYTCEIIGSVGDIYQKSTNCFDSNGDMLSGVRVISTPVNFQLNRPNYIKEGITLPDGRVYTAKILSDDPGSICLYKTARETVSPWRSQDADATDAEKVGIAPEVLAQGGILEQCIGRPDMMPKPTLRETPYSSDTDVQFYLFFGGQVGTIGYTPNDIKADNDDNCATLNGFEFCLSQKCNRYDEETQECADFDPWVCLSGFDSGYEVIVDRETKEVIEGVPNTLVGNRYIYSPPTCYERDSNGACLNRSANCKTYDETGTFCQDYENEITNDPYIIDPNSHIVNASDAKNEGLCFDSRLADMGKTKFLYTGSASKLNTSNYKYTVPHGCGKLSIKLTGGGAAGRSSKRKKDCHMTYSGGAGAKGVWELQGFSGGEELNVSVGRGSFGGCCGSQRHGYMTKVTYANAELIAEGGYSNSEPPRGLSRSTYKVNGVPYISYSGGEVHQKKWQENGFSIVRHQDSRNGTDGVCSGNHWSYGYGPDGGPTAQDCAENKLGRGAYGSGGCGTYKQHASEGGHGYAEIQCIESRLNVMSQQRSCLSKRVFLKYTRNLGVVDYYECNLPGVGNGEIPSLNVCTELMSPPPSGQTIVTAIHDPALRAPLCDDSVWRY